MRIFTIVFMFVLVLDVRAQPQLLLPYQGITSSQLAVVINDEDPLSVAVGELYVSEHDIPKENIVRLRFSAESTVLSSETFSPLKKQLDASLHKSVQGLLLTWIKPYRVSCMSITSAFSLGFDRKYCSKKQCDATASSDYFNSAITQPYHQQGSQFRPSMMLGASNLAEAKALIARAQRADQSNPAGSAYLLSTSDRDRNVRARHFPAIKKAFGAVLNVETPTLDAIRDKPDVMFYFTGTRHVEALATNTFLPGAVADHLTSYGGMLTDSSQMSALEWLKAGATGSYGTVVEPCAHLQKFPNPGVLMQHYLAGETLLESYWKSVAWPGEGVFVGEPLSRPYKGYLLREKNGTEFFEIFYLPAGRYRLSASKAIFGPFAPVSNLVSKGQSLLIPVMDKQRPYYRLELLSRAN